MYLSLKSCIPSILFFLIFLTFLYGKEPDRGVPPGTYFYRNTAGHELNFTDKSMSIETIDLDFQGEKKARLQGTVFRCERPRAIVLLLPGLGAKIASYYPVALELLQERYMVFIYSPRAHGESTGEYDLELMVEDISRAIDALTARFQELSYLDIYVIGGSTGGMLGYIAASRDERIRKVVAIAAPVSFKDVSRTDSFYRHLRILNSRRKLVPDFITNLLVKTFVDSIRDYEATEKERRCDPLSVKSRWEEWEVRPLFKYNLTSKGIFATNYDNLHIRSGVEFVKKSLSGPTMAGLKLDIPVLLIAGEADDVTGTDTEEGRKNYRSLFKNHKVLIVPAEHRKRDYLTGTVIREVLDFLRE